ncbi:hypothetical protein D3C78_1801540 [compost metagenome]
MESSLFWTGFSSLPGTNSGLTSVPSTSSSTAAPSSPSRPDSATQRTRCVIRVLGTLAFTL